MKADSLCPLDAMLNEWLNNARGDNDDEVYVDGDEHATGDVGACDDGWSSNSDRHTCSEWKGDCNSGSDGTWHVLRCSGEAVTIEVAVELACEVGVTRWSAVSDEVVSLLRQWSVRRDRDEEEDEDDVDDDETLESHGRNILRWVIVTGGRSACDRGKQQE